MSAAGTMIAESQTTVTAAPRIVSIDIFRGLTMAVMIFVNALPEGNAGLPWWTYHAHAEQDLMTYVDMVFPFFLFIIGLSLPLSVAQRLKRNPSVASLWVHVVHRSLSLLALGLILANAEKVDRALTGMSGNLWGLLGIVACALYLNVYPKSERFPAYSTILRGIGLLGVIAIFAVFRRTTNSGNVAWIDFSYPEILGLIGCSYFAAAILYIPTRRWKWAAAAGFVLMALLCIGTAARVIPHLGGLSLYVWPFGNGSMPCLILAGAAVSQFFLGVDPVNSKRPDPKTAMKAAVAFSAIALAAGWIAVPLGISKIRATPSWTLWCAGAAALAFTLLYWLCDRKGQTSWAFLVRSAGSNTLLTYLLPDLWYFVMGTLGFYWLDNHFAYGASAVIKTVLFTVFMLVLSLLLTKAKLRLQL